jgi:hypothetical protein
MNLTAFSFLASSNPEVDESQEVELTIGSLSILIGPSGSSRLSDPTKPDPSASNPETEEILESSEGSSSEVNSLVSLEKVSIAEGDKSQEIFELEDKAYQSYNNAKDLAIRSNDVSKVHQLCVIITEEEGNNNNGISVRIIPTQEETKGGKGRDISRQQQHIRRGILGKL